MVSDNGKKELAHLGESLGRMTKSRGEWICLDKWEELVTELIVVNILC